MRSIQCMVWAVVLGTVGAIGGESDAGEISEIASTYERVSEPPPLDASFKFEFLTGPGFIQNIIVRLPDGVFDRNSPLLPVPDEFAGMQPDDVTVSFLSSRSLSFDFRDGSFQVGAKAKYVMDIDGGRGDGMELIVRASENRYDRGLFDGDDHFATATVQAVLVPEPATVELAAIAACVLCLFLRRSIGGVSCG
jgi:hypothetical protein